VFECVRLNPGLHEIVASELYVKTPPTPSDTFIKPLVIFGKELHSETQNTRAIHIRNLPNAKCIRN